MLKDVIVNFIKMVVIEVRDDRRITTEHTDHEVFSNHAHELLNELRVNKYKAKAKEAPYDNQV